MGKYDLAVADYDEAIRLAPNDGGLFIDRGKIFRTESRFDQAISDFSHALDLDKKWTAAYRERGLTHKLMGQSHQALDDLTTYDQLQPGDQEVALPSRSSGAVSRPRVKQRSLGKHSDSAAAVRTTWRTVWRDRCSDGSRRRNLCGSGEDQRSDHPKIRDR